MFYAVIDGDATFLSIKQRNFSFGGSAFF